MAAVIGLRSKREWLLRALLSVISEVRQERDELKELLADLAMERKISGLGDPVAEVNDQTGTLGRVRAVLGGEFLNG